MIIILSLYDCNIYTDPKGSLVEELGAWLSEQRNTRVYTLNLYEMEKACTLIRFFTSAVEVILKLSENAERQK